LRGGVHTFAAQVTVQIDTARAKKDRLNTQARDAYMNEEQEPVLLPIDGTLDLHAFHPRDIKDLVPTYLAACREKGLLQVRIIHGKGVGIQRQLVHGLLDGLPEVTSYRLAGEDGGGWGATLVVMRPLK
jgi:DNA-nicking Smr family endonuclease